MLEIKEISDLMGGLFDDTYQIYDMKIYNDTYIT